ncbi:MAG TPA: hypothetical protein ENJ00_03460 [Phycisphaerales bacterium]|nr:hypothetical protein [Phycisphaerales bacterium]
MNHAAEHAFDPADPHGFHAGHEHHGHVIVKWQTLLAVLLALLALTVLTVFTARLETYISGTWGWDLPYWLNIVIAMSIAVVKGTLVVLFFMQIKYDKSINGILLLFTLMAVGFFILFTSLDLGNRDRITSWRAGEIVPGGTGVGVRRADVTGPIWLTPKEEYIAKYGLETYERELAHHHAKHGHHEPDTSTAWASRPKHGLTPGLFHSGPWAELNTGDEHGGEQPHTEAAAGDESEH